MIAFDTYRKVQTQARETDSRSGHKLTMIDKFGSSTRTRTPMYIKGLWCTDWRHASLWLDCAVVHIKGACTPKIFWLAWFFHPLTPILYLFRWNIPWLNYFGLQKACKPTSALFQMLYRSVKEHIRKHRLTKQPRKTVDWGTTSHCISLATHEWNFTKPHKVDSTFTECAKETIIYDL